MKILLLGSGGREHALAWKISQSPKLEKLFIAPGNAGTSAVGENVDIKADDFENIASFVLSQKIDMVVVGPEDPLVKGIYDYFLEREDLKQIPVIGPSKAGAVLELVIAKFVNGTLKIAVAHGNGFQVKIAKGERKKGGGSGDGRVFGDRAVLRHIDEGKKSGHQYGGIIKCPKHDDTDIFHSVTPLQDDKPNHRDHKAKKDRHLGKRVEHRIKLYVPGDIAPWRADLLLGTRAVVTGAEHRKEQKRDQKDKDQQELTYQVSINDGAYTACDANYSFNTDLAGTYVLKFKASDGLDESTAIGVNTGYTFSSKYRSTYCPCSLVSFSCLEMTRRPFSLSCGNRVLL